MDCTKRIPGNVSHKRTGGKDALSLPPPSSGLRACSEDVCCLGLPATKMGLISQHTEDGTKQKEPRSLTKSSNCRMNLELPYLCDLLINEITNVPCCLSHFYWQLKAQQLWTLFEYSKASYSCKHLPMGPFGSNIVTLQSALPKACYI